MPWPPQLPDLKDHMSRADDRDDAALAAVLQAAIAYVEQARAGDFNFTADPASLLPPPDASFALGTVQLAMRWFARRQTPDGLTDMGELGTVRIPSTDADIERLLGIGRFRAPMVG